MKGGLFHGGRGGLVAGDRLLPSPPAVTCGCPVCAARAAGRAYTVEEYRGWLRGHGEAARSALEALEDADGSEIVDPPSARAAVYVTTDREYAEWYAARSRGDLYRVEAVGELEPSEEDPFPSWTVPEAVVVEVLRRRVRLDRRARRSLLRRWRKSDRKNGPPKDAPV